jgi:hypothetical protein
LIRKARGTFSRKLPWQRDATVSWSRAEYSVEREAAWFKDFGGLIEFLDDTMMDGKKRYI